MVLSVGVRGGYCLEVAHHRVWISAKKILLGQPGIIERIWDGPDIVDTRWHERLELPAGAVVRGDAEGERGRVAWIEWDD